MKYLCGADVLVLSGIPLGERHVVHSGRQVLADVVTDLKAR